MWRGYGMTAQMSVDLSHSCLPYLSSKITAPFSSYLLMGLVDLISVTLPATLPTTSPSSPSEPLPAITTSGPLGTRWPPNSISFVAVSLLFGLLRVLLSEYEEEHMFCDALMR